MKSNKLLISAEELEQFCKEQTDRLRKHCVVEDAHSGFVELESTRYAVFTYYGNVVFELKDLKRSCIEFIDKLINMLDSDKTLYLRSELKVHYVYSSHKDPQTSDWMEKPNRAFWSPTIRLVQPWNEKLSLHRSSLRRL